MLRVVIAVAALVWLPPAASAYASGAQQMTLSVDANDAMRQVWHAHLTVPVLTSGELVLVYPKWIPGNHGPTGPIANLGSLHAACDGNPVPWTRDAIDPYTFRFAVPAGAHKMDINYDLYEGTRSAADMTAQLAVLDWNQVVLYPKDTRITDITVTADIDLPPAWTAATALLPAAGTQNQFTPLSGHVHFAPVTLETLVDSPLYTGAHERVVPLVDARGLTSEVDLFGETQATSSLPQLRSSAGEISLRKPTHYSAGVIGSTITIS